MEEEVEDMVGDVKYTDSQKSIATRSSNVYSSDFTDNSSRDSDKNHSSGQETYVLEWDSEDSDHTYPLQDCLSQNVISDTVISKVTTVHCEKNVVAKSASTSLHRCLIAQEICTQTSKTIMELAESEANIKVTRESNSLETQTSFISITENKTVEYRIEVSGGHHNLPKETVEPVEEKQPYLDVNDNKEDSIEDDSSKFPVSDTENSQSPDGESVCSSVIQIINDDSQETIPSENKPELYEATSEYEESLPPSDVEEDSLTEPTDSNKDVQELRDKISENQDVCMARFDESIRRFGTLTPLTEESNLKKDSLMDITPSVENIVDVNKDDVLFTSNAGMKVKLLRNEEANTKDSFKLPPIQNRSCPNSPHLSSLFGKAKLSKADTLPSVYERQSLQDRWEMATKALASGESLLISGRSASPRKSLLPPIQSEVPAMLNRIGRATSPPSDAASEAISIKDKIKELKTKQRKSESRGASPCNGSMVGEQKLCEVADRGCEVLCAELLRRLRAGTWFEIVDTLEELPRVMEKFWNVISEQRIADLVRQVSTHIESPRPQVARTACATMSAVLKNTSYTKKPDFYEAVTTLLTKTGSYSRAVRRAANVALDDVMCGAALAPAVTALCLHGVSHKNALVRCAAARLLVVCCALGAGGRELLRARPATAAAARRHALRALAALLDDKCTDARKYAERLYSMLRPLSNFEAYYLTDVEVDTASRQMKKYDNLLLTKQTKDNR